MQIWRLTRERYSGSAFSGEGSRQNEGRWHAFDMPVVYTSSSLALACVEVFVNLDPLVVMPRMVSLAATIADELLADHVDPTLLPEDWRVLPSPSCRGVGSDWFLSRRSAALVVPSAAVMGETNILLNPLHPDFAGIAIGRPQPFRFDPRMFRHA